MFLANSLKEKLKRDFMDVDNDEGGQPLHRYDPPPKDPRILLSIKETMKSNPDIQTSSLWNIPSQQLHSMDKNDWEKTFTVSKLHLRWKEKGQIDFENKFKKFPDNAALPGVIEKKNYVKDIKDPDILDLKQPKWNISTNAKEKIKPNLKKTVFEVKNGLKDFQVVPLKEPHIYEGVESRNKMEIDGNTWNVSNYYDRKEISDKDKEDLMNAKENSVKYWKNNEYNRYYQRPLPISNERKKIEVIRYFKKYRTPYQKTVDFQNTMDKVKEATFFDKENVEKKVKKNNPGMEKYPEKINALVYKEMYGIYKDKYNEFIGNLPKEELKKRQMEKNKFRWNDKDLVNKITAINKMTNTGIFEDFRTSKLQSTKNTLHRSQSSCNNNSILLPLVIRGNEINKEEEKIQEKLEEEYKKEQKRQMLLELKGFKKRTVENKFESRYPLTKEEYINTKHLNEENFDTTKNENNLLNTINKKNNHFLSSPNLDVDNIGILNEISKSSDCNPHFLEAYNRVAGKEFEKMNELNKKMKENLVYKYTHPGVFRQFTFVENTTKIKTDITGQQITEIVPKKVSESFWSCCMNSDPDSRGCQKIATKNFKWNYN